jgi:hypothetical protein
MKQTKPRLFTSLGAYIEWMGDEDRDITEIMAAVYFKSASMENKFVVPHEFSAFKAVRDRKGVITHITDSKGNDLSGHNLSSVLIFSAMREKGMASIIMVKSNDSTIEVLAIPSGVQIDTTPLGKGVKDFHDNARTLYTHKAGTAVYATPDLIEAILLLDYVDISEVTNLLKALNALAAKEDLTNFAAEVFDDFNNILVSLQDQEAKQSRKHFLQTLMAASISKMSMQQRIGHFSGNPSYTLANNLELRLPHGGPCYTKLGNKPATKVALSTLGPDDNVLMSTNIMSQKDYKSIMGNVADYLVYVDSDNLGGRKGQKFASMSVKFVESAPNVTTYLSAIATANGEGKSGSNVQVPDPVDPNAKAVELDLDA